MNRHHRWVMGFGLILALAPTLVAQTLETPAASNGRTIAVPNSTVRLFLWDEVNAAGQTEHHYSIMLDGSTVGRSTTANYLLGLRHNQFDPLVGVPAVEPIFQAPAGSNLYFVQFYTQSLEEFRNEITAAGGQVFAPFGDFTHVVRMNSEVKAQVEALPYVRWVGPYDLLYRLDEAIVEQIRAGAESMEPARVSIMLLEVDEGPQQNVAQRINALGGDVEMTAGEVNRMEATLNGAQLLEIAAMDDVLFIDPWGPGSHDMDIARQIGGAVPILSGAGITGQGVRGEIFDTEVISNHQEWAGQAPLIHGVNGNSGTHGSSCYGINFATGVNPQATGMMPNREQGIFYHYPQSTQFGGAQTRLAANTEATNPAGAFRSVFQTSSVGSPQTTTYTTISAETDDYLWRVDYLSCQSQSNTSDNRSRPQAWAKNMMSTSGVGHQNTLSRADDTRTGTSIGYASDGRVKPELMHFYDSIFTTTAGVSSYTNFGGTSGATPINCGHHGLIMQMWHQQVFPGHGGAATVFLSRPKSTTARALSINTAFQYNWLAGGSNGNLTRNVQGWGMVDVGYLYNVRNNMFIVNETDVLMNLQTKSYDIDVNGANPLHVTMVYSDPQGNPANQAQHRVNDLNLKVTSPGGTIYWGNNGLLTALVSAAGGAADTKNTVENVFINSPQVGQWTVEVTAAVLIQDARLETPGVTDADYALVVSGGVEVTCFLNGDMNGDGDTNGLDLAQFIAAVLAGSTDPNILCRADFNESNMMDPGDIPGMVTALMMP